MSRLIELWRRLCPVLAVGLLLMAGLSVMAEAQQPTRVNPTESSVREKQLLDALKPGADNIGGRVSIPDARSATLIQPSGRDWRTWREVTLPRIGMFTIGGMLVALFLFFIVRHRIRIEDGFSGETVTRFNGIERFGHWLMATSFIVLALTGLNMTFGRQFLLPVVGPELFTEISQWAKYLHNYMSFAFVIGLVMVFFMWVVFNFPMPSDLKWIAQGGGIIGSKHPPAGRFNFGQKIIFWTTVLGGFALSVTGYMLMFPFYQPPVAGPVDVSAYTTTVAGIQLVSILHGVIALVMIAVILAHIYIGTMGMQGAFWAMGTGKVDKNWARQHHSIWATRVLGEKGGKTAPAE